MANPQTEDGHLQIANDLWEAIARQDLSGQEFRVLIAVIRKTYGFKKKQDWLTNRCLAMVTGLHTHSVSRAVTRLAERNILRVNQNVEGYKRIVGINKDYDTWRGLTISLGVNQNAPKGKPKRPKGLTDTGRGIHKSVKDTYKRNSTKETLTKETLTKETTAITEIWKFHENLPQPQKITPEIRNAVKYRIKNGATVEQVENVCAWYESQLTDPASFWGGNNRDSRPIRWGIARVMKGKLSDRVTYIFDHFIEQAKAEEFRIAKGSSKTSGKDYGDAGTEL